MSKSNHPYPVRFDDPEDQSVRELKQKTGLSISDLIKRCARFALPKFESGEVDLLDYGPAAAPDSVTQEEDAA